MARIHEKIDFTVAIVVHGSKVLDTLQPPKTGAVKWHCRPALAAISRHP